MSEKGCESVSFGVFHISTVGFFILVQLRFKSIKLLIAFLNQDLIYSITMAKVVMVTMFRKAMMVDRFILRTSKKTNILRFAVSYM